MYEARVEAKFQARHRLSMSEGRHEPYHPHNWWVQAVFQGEQLDDNGLLIDFERARKALDETVAPLSNADLNAAPLLAGQNPTTENVARAIFEALSARLSPGHTPAAVYVQEATGCIAGYVAPSPGGDTGPVTPSQER